MPVDVGKSVERPLIVLGRVSVRFALYMECCTMASGFRPEVGPWKVALDKAGSGGRNVKRVDDERRGVEWHGST